MAVVAVVAVLVIVRAAAVAVALIGSTSSQCFMFFAASTDLRNDLMNEHTDEAETLTANPL